jgi:hypothetical protein
MKSELKTRRLEELADAWRSRDLRPNREYQRGPRWKEGQQQALIDSLLRGYDLPLFYVHLKPKVNQFTRETETTVELVDGQQRLLAIKSYLDNEFALPDPAKEDPGTVLPTLVTSQPQPRWVGKRFEELEPADKERLLGRQLLVIYMTEEAPNEVRDLFIRLQAGTPLTAQEKRDAWPGDFTTFVIRHAGKPEHPDENPKPFFKLVKRGRAATVDEGEDYVDGLVNTRKFFAGLAMTIMVRERSGEDFVDLKGKTIDEFYQENLDLNDEDPGVKRVVRTLDTVADLPGFPTLLARKRVTYSIAFHFALLVDSLNSNTYVPVWRDGAAEAFLAFQNDLAKAKKHLKETRESLPHHARFLLPLSGSGSDTAKVIRPRHFFFLDEMYGKMNIRLRDEQRLFGPLEKEIIWNRDGRKCQNPRCGRQVNFNEVTIHHVIEHVAGGRTILENGVLVCPECHANRTEMQSLTPVFLEYLQQVSQRNTTVQPQRYV